MIRKFDRLWFRLIGFAYRWLVHCANAHCRREQIRRFRRHLAWQQQRWN